MGRLNATYGRTREARVSSKPRFFIRINIGTSVAWTGINMPKRKKEWIHRFQRKSNLERK